MATADPRTVLIVDDEPFILAAVSRLLRSHGHTVHTCDEWTQVAAAVRTNQPDVVLMDYNMPSIKGDDLCSILKRNNHGSQVRIIIFSSEPEIELVKIVERCGADGYIKKDLPAESLIEHLDRILSASAA